MADTKIYSVEELKKMSPNDLKDLHKDVLKVLAFQKLKVRTNEDKQSHKIKNLKRQIARIKTLSNQTPNNEK